MITREYFRQIIPALKAFFPALPSWFRTRYLWGFLAAPVACMLVVYQLADANFWGWRTASTLKATMEIAHPSLLAAGALLGIGSWIVTRRHALAFMGVMCLFAFSREIGGQGTSILMYTGLVLLITYGYLNPDKLVDLLGSRLASSALATAFICYAISQLLDRGVIKRLGWGVTWDTSWKPPYSSQMEESLETLGGACLLFTTLILLIYVLKGVGQDSPERS